MGTSLIPRTSAMRVTLRMALLTLLAGVALASHHKGKVSLPLERNKYPKLAVKDIIQVRSEEECARLCEEDCDCVAVALVGKRKLKCRLFAIGCFPKERFSCGLKDDCPATTTKTPTNTTAPAQWERSPLRLRGGTSGGEFVLIKSMWPSGFRPMRGQHGPE